MEDIKRYDLELLEKSRKKIRNGDVFVVKLLQRDLYFYGKVIDVKAKMGGFAEPMLIFLYKTPSTEIIIPNDMDENDVMTAILSLRDGWRDGVFKTICNIPVNEKELNLDYGFESPSFGGFITKEEVEKYSKNHEILYCKDGRILTSAYIDAYENIRDHIPKIIGKDSLCLWPGVSWRISKYLHNNPEIREKYGLD